MPPHSLKSAVELAKAGKKEEARQILGRILEHDPNNELAFFWYLDTLPGNKERIQELQTFLSKHPKHERAQIALQALLDLTGKKPAETTAKPAPSGEIIDGEIIQEGQPPEDSKQELEALSRVQMDAAALKRRERDRVRLQKKAQPSRSGLKVAIILLLVLAIAASFIIPSILNNPALKPKDERYAMEMEPVIAMINIYMDGPVAEWSEVMSEQVYEGNDSTYRELLYYNMRMGYSDVLVSRKLSPIAMQISVDGTEIMTVLSNIEPPEEILEAHVDMATCINYEIEWAVALTEFLTNSQTRELPENPCDSFPYAFSAVKDYVEKHR